MFYTCSGSTAIYRKANSSDMTFNQLYTVHHLVVHNSGETFYRVVNDRNQFTILSADIFSSHIVNVKPLIVEALVTAKDGEFKAGQLFKVYEITDNCYEIVIDGEYCLVDRTLFVTVS